MKSVSQVLFAAAFYSLVWSTSAFANEGIGDAVHKVFEARCFKCHGKPGERVRGGFDYVLDFKKLRQSALLNLGDPESSELFELINTGAMPYKEDRLSAQEVKLILDWLKAGAPDAKSTATEGDALSNEDIVRLILDDLEGISPEQQRAARYLSFAHWRRAGVETKDLPGAVSKFINSLSWQNQLVVVTPVDSGLSLYRIDLSRLARGEDWWRTLTDDYPYNRSDVVALAKAISTKTRSTRPFVNGDWLIYSALRPPKYHRALDLPANAKDLEALLGVDAEGNIRAAKVIRSGFRGGQFSGGSGVSRNNRLIERHATPFGAYWKSYDFSGNIGTQDLFSFPLGPIEGPFQFSHAGGEMIFNLPNGLQAYFLTNAKGGRLDVAPHEIVQDSSRADGVIVNGMSCIACHAQGIRDHDDEIRSHVLGNPGRFPRQVADSIIAMHPETTALRTYLESDRQRFLKALRTLGLPERSAVEPIRRITDAYEAPVSLQSASAELGLLPEELLAQGQRNRALQPIVGELAAGGMTRDKFESLFSIIIGEILNLPELGRRSFTTRSEFPFTSISFGSGQEDLRESASNCDLARARAALRAGADASMKDVNGRRPIDLALANSCESVAGLLVERMTAQDLEENTSDGASALHQAIARNLKDVLQVILVKSGLTLTTRDWRGNTPLNLAVFENSLKEIVAALVAYRPQIFASVNLCNQQGACPLHLATASGDPELVAMVLSIPSTDVNLRDGAGLRSLALARRLARERPGRVGYSEISRMLAERGAKSDFVRRSNK